MTDDLLGMPFMLETPHCGNASLEDSLNGGTDIGESTGDQPSLQRT